MYLQNPGLLVWVTGEPDAVDLQNPCVNIWVLGWPDALVMQNTDGSGWVTGDPDAVACKTLGCGWFWVILLKKTPVLHIWLCEHYSATCGDLVLCEPDL